MKLYLKTCKVSRQQVNTEHFFSGPGSVEKLRIVLMLMQ